MDLTEALKKHITQCKEWATDAFGIGSSGLIGINIGQSAVKISEVIREPKGNAIKLIRYSSEPLSEGTVIEDEIQNEEDLINAIRNAVQAGGFSTQNAALGLFGSNVVVKRLKLAGGTPDEVENQVFWEAEHYIPFNIDSSYISYHVVANTETEGCDIIIAAATKDFVNGIKDIVEKSGVKVKSVIPDPLAIANVFQLVCSDELADVHHSYLILNIGGQKTDLIVYSNDGVSFTKEIGYGGLMITEEIQRRMGVTYEEAEDLKAVRNEHGKLPEEIQLIIDEVIDIFLEEVKKTVDFYIKTTSDEEFYSCYITGGGAQTVELKDGLESLLGLDVLALNPFDAVKVETQNFSEDQIDSMSFQAVTSIGLSMGGTKDD